MEGRGEGEVVEVGWGWLWAVGAHGEGAMGFDARARRWGRPVCLRLDWEMMNTSVRAGLLTQERQRRGRRWGVGDFDRFSSVLCCRWLAAGRRKKKRKVKDGRCWDVGLSPFFVNFSFFWWRFGCGIEIGFGFEK